MSNWLCFQVSSFLPSVFLLFECCQVWICNPSFHQWPQQRTMCFQSFVLFMFKWKRESYVATIWVCQSAIYTLWVLHILREVGAELWGKWVILRVPSLCPSILGWFSSWNSLCREEFDEGKQHICYFSQLIRDIRYACLTWLLSMKVEIDQLPTLPISLLRTSSPTSGGPLAPSGSLAYINSTPSNYLYI